MIESEARRCMKYFYFARYQDKILNSNTPYHKKVHSIFDTIVTHFWEIFLQSHNERADTKITELID